MKNRQAILLLLLANSISGVAQGISMLAIPWYFTKLIHEEALFGQCYFVITAISLFWGIYAGAIVDRYDRRKIFLTINICGLVILSSIAALGFAQQELHWSLVAAVFATTALIFNIHFPNLYAYAQEITPSEHYGKVTSQLEIQGQLTWTISGGLAAVLLSGVDGSFNFFGWKTEVPVHIEAWDVWEVFALDACTYLISLLIIWRIRSLPVSERTPDTGTIRERVKIGLGFLVDHPLIFTFGNASLLVFLTILISGTYLGPMYVDRVLHGGGDVYAMGDMVFSMGALLAGFLTRKIFGERSLVKGIIILAAISGLMYVVQVFSAITVVFFLTSFVIGACNSAVRIQRVTYLFHHIPNNVIGRANSVFFVINVFLRMVFIGLFTFPFFHRGTNVTYAVAILAGICVVCAVTILIKYEQLENETL